MNNIPNPSSVFGRHQSSRTSESLVAPATAVEVPEPRDDEAVQARRVDNQLGNGELPIAIYREQIVDAVNASQATVITAETGAGKSTQVPQFLAEAGYEVIVTQPRVVAARSVAERVRDEIVAEKGADYADFVGYRTAREHADSSDNQILFVTDGLQLVCELSGNGAGKKQALVLDEVHEWNENMEVLVAWAKQRMAEDPDFKVVTMSATIEAGPLAKYFAGESEREVPIIDVPGRTFEVEKHERIVNENEVYPAAAYVAASSAASGKNVLIFAPGVGEIKTIMEYLDEVDVTVVPLYGKQEKQDQGAAFQTCDGPKIVVATNVAETSLTIPGIDTVVDTGVERRKEAKNGVEGLYLRPVAKANCLQRAGRAGRTKEGEYYLVSPAGLDEREAYKTPEILRTRLDGMILRLAKGGLDAAGMEFYNVERQGETVKQQFEKDVVAAKERLQKLGALREDGSITKIGRDMDRMPVESHYARMMIEARKYGPEVRQQLAAILAAQEVGGVTFKGKNSERRWRQLTSGDTSSDMIAELEVFIGAQKLSYKERREYDVMSKNFSKAQEVFRQLRRAENLKDGDLSKPTKEQREQLIKCIISGMVDHLYIAEWDGYRNGSGGVRELSNRTVVRDAQMVVGNPFDLQITTRRGLMTLNLLESVTAVPSTDVLREVAPQLFTERSQGLMMDGEVVHEKFAQVFNGQDTGERVLRPAEESLERTKYLARYVAEQQWHSDKMQAIRTEVDNLNARLPGAVEVISWVNFLEVTTRAMPAHVATIAETVEYVPQVSLDDLISPDAREAIYAQSPDEFDGHPLRYEDGVPMIRVSDMYEDAILALVPGDMVLPDGREIILRGMGSNTLDVTELQQRVLQDRAERAEAAARKKRAEQRREEMKRQIDQLLRDNRDMYDLTKPAGIDDDVIPEDIWDKLNALRHSIDAASKSLNADHEMLNRGLEISVEAHVAEADRLRAQVNVLVQELKDWQQTEEERAHSTVSASDLATLMAKFNNR